MAGVSAQEAATYFPYPTPPESLPMGRPRANYMVEHFWDHAPWKTVYTAPARMEATLRDFAGILPLASPDTVQLSIAKLIKESSKKPQWLSQLLKMARATFRSDSAELFSAEVYIPFARAGVQAKKLSAEEREQFARELKWMESTSVGHTLPALQGWKQDGTPVSLNDTTPGAGTYVLILEKPGDLNARFERVRLMGSAAVRALVEAGAVHPTIVHAGRADDEWWRGVEGLPAGWEAVELPDAEEYFDLRVNPSVFILDGDMTVVGEWMPVSLLIANCENIVNSLQ